MTLTIAARHRSACYYAEDIETFVAADPAAVLGELAASNQGSLQTTQLDAWTSQLGLLQQKLRGFSGRGRVYFEFIVPRLGKRIDVLALIDHVIFSFEFKVGEKSFARAAIEQVWDYALDLKNFHETSHAAIIAPILIATEANDAVCQCFELDAHGECVGGVTPPQWANGGAVIAPVVHSRFGIVASME